MKQLAIQQFESKFLRKKPLPDFRSGDTVCVYVKIQEGAEKDGTPKFRLQPYEGVVIRYQKGSTNSTFLVRKMGANGVGVERNFFVHSPLVDSVAVKARGKVRRARIYYIRKLKGKAARIESRYYSQKEAPAAAE
jgi:large subunit ribosomal protein L19